MGTCYINNSGSGAALNFKVIGYTSEESLEASKPSNNAIGIITDITITGWYFGPVAPQNPVAGMVWIKTGDSSDVSFNALKRNGIVICPVTAYQYRSYNWYEVEAKTYQNGAWREWGPSVLYLYNNGDECSEVTGGLKKQEYSDYMIVMTAKSIDISKYKTLEVNVNRLSGELYFGFGRTLTEALVEWKISTTGVFRQDISSLSGSVYIGFRFFYGSDPAIDIREIKLLR